MEANLSFEKKSSRAPLTEGCCRLAFPCMRPSAGTAPFCTSSRQTWISARPLYSVVQLLICSRPFQSKNSNVRGGGGVGEAAGRGEAKGEERKKTEEQRENADGISMHPLWDPRRWRTGNKTWLHCGWVQRGAGLCGCVVLRTYDSGRAARKTCGEESWGCKKSGFLSEFDVFALLDRVMWCFFCLRCRSASPEKWHFIHDVTAIRYCVMRQQKAGFKGSVHIFNLNPGGFSGNVRSVGFICTFIYPFRCMCAYRGQKGWGIIAR